MDNYAPPGLSAGQENGKLRYSDFKHITPEVLSALAGGDCRAFDTVYLRCFEPIQAFFRVLLHNDAEAEELTQELFVCLWEHHGTIDPARNFRSYLYTIAKSAALKHLRHKRVADKYADFRLHDALGASGAADEALIESELRLLIGISLEKMPEQRRKVFEMSRSEGLSHGEIAARLGLSESTVRTHLHHALNDLRELICLILIFLAT